ncbi:MAG: DinB family protein [Terracidiphilus sp.]
MSVPPAPTPYTEPRLRGAHSDVPAAGRAVLHALELSLDDLTKWTAGLTYAEGKQLSAEQLASLKVEQGGEGKLESLAELLAEVEASFRNAAGRIRILATANLNTPRSVGRKQMPTSIGGALIHVADHTQRHTGQVVTTAKVLKALRA